MNCPNCQSANLRGGKTDLPKGTLYEYCCSDCGLFEQKLGTEPGFHAWIARWEPPTGRTMAERLSALKKWPSKTELEEASRTLMTVRERSRDSTEEALLQGVLDDPDSDAPRESYAAWLDAAGDARGEFIRAQLEHSALRKQRAPLSKWGPVFDRANELLETWRAEWLQPIDPLIMAKSVKQPVFYRGFVESIEVSAEAFLDRFDDVVALEPIRFLALTKVGHRAGEVFASPSLERIRALDLSRNGLTDADVALLSASPYLVGLRWLCLSFNKKLSAASLEHLAQSPHLGNLRYVGFSNNAVEDPKDEVHMDGSHVAYAGPSDLGGRLEEEFGALPWLHWPEPFSGALPHPDGF
jgi:uncharacterized protein (TIGR02996 family)